MVSLSRWSTGLWKVFPVVESQDEEILVLLSAPADKIGKREGVPGFLGLREVVSRFGEVTAVVSKHFEAGAICPVDSRDGDTDGCGRKQDDFVKNADGCERSRNSSTREESDDAVCDKDYVPVFSFEVLLKMVTVSRVFGSVGPEEGFVASGDVDVLCECIDGLSV